MIELAKELGIDSFVFIDFETYYDSSIGYDLKNISMTEYIRDSRFKVHGFASKVDAGPVIWQRMMSECVHKNIAIVAHNVKFDGAILAWKYGVNPKLWIDTKSMAKAVLGNRVNGFSLRELAEHFGLKPKGQLLCDGKRDLTATEENELAEYCIHDTELCSQIFWKLASDFPVGQYKMMDWTIRAFTEPKLVIDVPLLERMVENEKETRSASIANSGCSKKSLSSNKQFADVLKQAGIEVPTKRSKRTGKTIPAFSLADEGFLALRETAPELFLARKSAKSTIYETRGLKYINVGRTGSLPFDVEFSGAVQTHRFSGGNGAGGNPQNIPKSSDFRRAICAPSGYKLIVGDFSQIELRILAYLSKCPALIKALESGADIYSEFASKVYGRTITKADEKERFVGKCAVLGLGYGMGAKRFKYQLFVQAGIKITQQEAERIVKLYRGTYPEVPALWKSLETVIGYMTQNVSFGTTSFLKVDYQSITLPSGLKLQYPNLRREGREWLYDVYIKRYQAESTNLYGGKLAENICQALAGEICKEAIQNTGFRAVGQVHDELLLVSEPRLEDSKLAVHWVKGQMERSLEWWPALQIKCAVGIGNNWAESKL